MLRNLWLVAALLMTAVGTALAASPALELPPGAREAAGVIDRDALEGPVRFLADDLLEGRVDQASSFREPGLSCPPLGVNI
jgi:hypothetical protein